MRVKYLIGHFELIGVFREGQDFFDPQIVLSAGQEHRIDLLCTSRLMSTVEKPAETQPSLPG